MSERQFPVVTIAGWGLVLLGGLWVLLTGGCTLMVVVSSIANAIRYPSSGSGSAAFLVIGAICIAPGVGMLWLGVKTIRKSRPSDRSRTADPKAFD